MSVAAAQAEAFYREFLASRVVFTVRDAGGYPAPISTSGHRAQPFWSKRSRAQRIIDTVPDYGPFEIVEMGEDRWLDEWLPGLERDGLLVGINWSGSGATGYDLSVTDLRRNLAARGLGATRV